MAAGTGWQQLATHSLLKHTHCFCSWHLFPVHPNYNSITESCDSPHFITLEAGQGSFAVGWGALSSPFLLFIIAQQSCRFHLTLMFAVPKWGCLEARPGHRDNTEAAEVSVLQSLPAVKHSPLNLSTIRVTTILMLTMPLLSPMLGCTGLAL